MPRRFQSSGRTIDFKQWTSVPGLSTQVAADGLVAGGALAFTEPATILRMLGGGDLVLFNASKQADDSGDFCYAIGVVSSDAFAAGVASLPDPTSEPDYPWLFWHFFSLESQITLGTDSLGLSSYRIPPWSSKAMRKMKPGQSLVMLLDVQGMTGAPTTIIELSPIRVLIGT